MTNLSLKALVGIAVAVGLFAAVAALVVQNIDISDKSTASAQDSSKDKLDPANLPPEVLKALPPEQLAELFPEKAEAILVPEAFSQVKSAGGNSDDPEYLRAVLQKMGIVVPEGASTKELQDLLATAKQPGGGAQK
jgi:hypothetical protein